MREVTPEVLHGLQEANNLLIQYLKRVGQGADDDVIEAEVYLHNALVELEGGT